MKRNYQILSFIFTFACLIRLASVWPANTIIGFDQARDLFDSRKIVLDKDLRIVGPTAGNNANLHHGVAFLYFLIPPLILGGGNPIWAVLWNSLINASSIIVLFLFAKSLFKDKRAGIIAAIIGSVSYYYVQFSGWLSNPTVTLFTVPLFFLGFWQYKEDKSWGLPLAAFFLGLSIQFEIFFLYLIPTAAILFLVLKLKPPTVKIFVYSLIAICFSLSSMIATEIKFGFSGLRALLSATGGQKPSFFQNLEYFFDRFFQTFSQTLWPQNKTFAIAVGIFIIALLLYQIIRFKNGRPTLIFLLVYLFSPGLMLILGSHAAPWFLIGLPPAIILLTSFVLSKIKSPVLLCLCLSLIAFINLKAVINSYGQGQALLEPDRSATLSKQIAAMDYTYQMSPGENFAIDAVTNPLYINAVWAYNYNWYWHRYGYKPSWLGGDQIPPYDTLSKASGNEKYLFLIIDQTPRIPPIYTQNATNSMKKIANYIEEKEFDGIKVIMWKNKNYKNSTTIKAQ